MKKKFFFLFTISFFSFINAQVGINKDSPESVLDIVVRSEKNYALKAFNYQKDQVFNIDYDGNMGIGDESPNLLLGLNHDDGAIGIGASLLEASEAGAGTIKYDRSDQLLYFSNGANWNPISSKVIPLYTVANIGTSTTLFPNGARTQVTGWVIKYENNTAFEDGIFTVPRDGSYIFSLSLGFDPTSVSAGSYIEVELSIEPSYTLSMKSRKTFYVNASNIEPGANLTATATLVKGQKVVPYVYHNLGSSITLVPSECDLSIVEN